MSFPGCNCMTLAQPAVYPVEGARVGSNYIPCEVSKAHYRAVDRQSGPFALWHLVFVPAVFCFQLILRWNCLWPSAFVSRTLFLWIKGQLSARSQCRLYYSPRIVARENIGVGTACCKNP